MVTARDQRSGRSATLFHVIHRYDAHYPATFKVDSEDLPQFLQRIYETEYYRGYDDDSPPEYIENLWVCADAVEFSSKLEKVFNLADVKTSVYNLLAGPSPSEIDESKENTTTK